MNSFASDLKTRREQHRLTVRELAERIERSTTFITDFELRKKANPPEPEMMRRLAKVLNWSEDEQLRAWGYELSGGDDRRGNPFPLDDPRWRLVEGLKRLDLSDADAAFTVKALGQLLNLNVDHRLRYVGPLDSSTNPVDDMAHIRDSNGVNE